MQQAPVGCLGRPAYNYEMIIIELLVRSGVGLVKYAGTRLKQLSKQNTARHLLTYQSIRLDSVLLVLAYACVYLVPYYAGLHNARSRAYSVLRASPTKLQVHKSQELFWRVLLRRLLIVDSVG